MPRSYWSLNNLATQLGEVGRRMEALAAIQEATVIRRTLADANPDAYLPDLATSLNDLAGRRGEAGGTAGAAAAFAELLSDQLRVLGPDHPDTLTTRSNLARWRGEAGEDEDA